MDQAANRLAMTDVNRAHRRGIAPATARLLAAMCMFLSPIAALGDEQSVCAKKVFNRFCLGGPAASLSVTGQTAPFEGEMVILDDGKRVHVQLRGGQIVHVWREEPPGSWINYLEWRNKLIRVYGRGEERERFPPSARSRSARHNAVVTGKGRAETRWEQDGWRVSVTWDTTEFVALRYELRQKTGSQSDSDGL